MPNPSVTSLRGIAREGSRVIWKVRMGGMGKKEWQKGQWEVRM